MAERPVVEEPPDTLLKCLLARGEITAKSCPNEARRTPSKAGGGSGVRVAGRDVAADLGLRLKLIREL